MDNFVLDGFNAIYKISLALLRIYEERLLKAKDISELNKIMINEVRYGPEPNDQGNRIT